MKKLFSIILIVCLLVSLTACEQEESVPELLDPVETANSVYKVRKTTLESTVMTGGYIVPECVNMELDYDTTAFNVGVKLNDQVKKGQVLLELNPDLEEEIARLELSITREETEYEYDLEVFNKQIKDMKKFAGMMGGYDGRIMNLQIEESQLDFDKQHESLSEKILEDKETLEELKEEFKNSRITSPCDGTVVYINVSEDGDEIAENKTFLTIAKNDTKRLACGYISAEDYSKYSGAKAQIGEKLFDVTYIPYSDEELYELEREGSVFDSYFDADIPEDAKIGDYVCLYFTTEKKEPVLTIPTASLKKVGNQYSVTLVKSGYMEDQEITIGSSNLNYTEVTSGLQEGDVVYIAKNLARYGVTYEQKKAEQQTYSEMSKVTGATRTAQVFEPFYNKVQGKVKELYVKGIKDVQVKKGDPIYMVECTVNRSDLEQARIELNEYKTQLELDIQKREDAIDEKIKAMKKIKKTTLEYSIAELDLDDMQKSLEAMKEEANETLEEMQETLNDLESWIGQDVTVYAENDCVISSLANIDVGDTLSLGQYLYDLYDLNSFCFLMKKNNENTPLRYGQTVDLTCTVDMQNLTFRCKVISATNVRPVDAADQDMVYLEMENPDDYMKAAQTGILVFDNYGLSNCMMVSNDLIYHDRMQTEETDNKQQGGQQSDPWSGYNSNQNDVQSKTMDSDKNEASKGKSYVWVLDENGCAVKRYIRVVKTAENYSWVVDGIDYDDVMLVH